MGIKHNNNEIYFDMIEDMRAIVDKLVAMSPSSCLRNIDLI